MSSSTHGSASGTSTPNYSASGVSTPGADSDLPDLSTLDLTLVRDQGTLHSGYGAGSEAKTLSHPAAAHHDRVASRILSNSSASYALSPENLPTAPTDLAAALGGVNGNHAPLTNGHATPEPPSSTVATPGESRIQTPVPAPHGVPSNAKEASVVSAPMAVKGSSKSVEKDKKNVFSKLFDRSLNGSAVSLGHSTDDGGDKHHAHAAPPLARKASNKGKEGKKEEEPGKMLRVPSNGKREHSSERKTSTASETSRPRAPSHGEKEKEGGMGQALNDFMKIKVTRKTSVTSKRSDDGRSDAGESESRSRAGSTASLLKKYGVCEKVAIGKGATATVKLAHKWDRSSERLYAVKEFRKRRKNETEKEYVKKLTSEFCISSTLHHQNVVETVDLVQDEQNHWCEVMEYCPGGDLYAAIKKGSMTTPEINSYFKQILAGVSYLHSMGVAHRDIKPENLLLDAQGHIKITDFGVSDVFRMCWEKTTHLSKGLCGSEPYIAPEQFEQKEYDARLVDVWACAVVFYCMHFQELPWRVAKASDPSFGPYLQMYGGSSSPPPISNLVPRECRQLIKRMLDPDPKTRATTEQVEADPWFQAIVVGSANNGAPSHASSPSTNGVEHVSQHPIAAAS